MDRRDALKSLGSIAAATGMSVTPITVHETEKVCLVILKVKDGRMSIESSERLHQAWTAAVGGTPLEGVKAIVFDSAIDAEFVRR
jgi:hypothetical protein